MVRLPLTAHRQIVFGKLTKVFPFAIVTYCVQQTGVYTGEPTGAYTGGPKGGYSACTCPATARPARPNWPKAAAALALAALSTAFADAKVRSMALTAVSPILNIAGPRVFNQSAYGSCNGSCDLTRKSRFVSRISAAVVTAVVIVTRCVWMYPATYLPRWLFPPLKRRDPSHLGNGRSCAHPAVRGGAQPLSASDIDLLYESVTPTGRKPTRLGL